MCFFLKSAKSAGEQSCIPALSAAVNWILSETQLTRTGDYFFCFLGKNAKCKMQKKNQVTKKKVSIVWKKSSNKLKIPHPHHFSNAPPLSYVILTEDRPQH